MGHPVTLEGRGRGRKGTVRSGFGASIVACAWTLEGGREGERHVGFLLLAAAVVALGKEEKERGKIQRGPLELDTFCWHSVKLLQGVIVGNAKSCLILISPD